MSLFDGSQSFVDVVAIVDAAGVGANVVLVAAIIHIANVDPLGSDALDVLEYSDFLAVPSETGIADWNVDLDAGGVDFPAVPPVVYRFELEELPQNHRK